jgi:OmpA-OmpF porin, OOP family
MLALSASVLVILHQPKPIAMKKQLLLISIIIFNLSLFSQSIYHYNFEDSFQEANGFGPSLTVLGDEGSFVIDTLDKINQVTKKVYRFDKNSGFQLDNALAGGFLGHSYTIELYMKLDELDSWKRVVDWKNRKSDYGAYVYYGRLNFYPFQYSEEVPVEPGVYTYYVITRDSATQELLIYSDAEVKISFTDNGGNALLDVDQVLNFFHDDLVVPNEASSGSVAMLKIYSHKLEASTIAENYNQLSTQIFSVPEIELHTRIKVYPNPASDEIYIDLSEFSNYEPVDLKFFDVSGQLVFEQRSSGPHTNNVRIKLPEVPAGVYILSALSIDRNAVQKVMVNR